jgi:hypothetical protein
MLVMAADDVEAWREAAVVALGADWWSWIALRERDAVPEEMLAAIREFDAGPHPAAVAAAEWLRTIALDSSSARTWLLVGSHTVFAYCALASGSVPLTRRQREEVTLVAWVAKATEAEIDGRELVGHAASIAIEVRRLQATCVLALDPFDEDVRRLWMDRYGFREVAPPLESTSEASTRLWISLVPPQ